MKKVIFAVTFRDFDGTDNDLIQAAFLDSLVEQKSADIHLVVTSFGEKRVEAELQKRDLNYQLCQGKQGEGYRYSHTQVILNAIDYSEDNDVVVWTTVDMTFDPNFAQTLEEKLDNHSAAVVLPQLTYETLDEHRRKILPIVSYPGIDTICFPAKRLKELKKEIADFPNLDWGAYEHQLTVLAHANGLRCVNLFPATKIRKVVNGWRLTNDLPTHFKKSLAANFEVLEKYIDHKNSDPKFMILKEVQKIYRPLSVECFMKRALFYCIHRVRRLPGFIRMHLSRP